MMFTFLSPLFLIGLSAAAIPLLVHLSRSRRARKMSFSTTRFFTDQFLRSYRMSRLKEIGLLIARMALFALFAAALARPILMTGGRALVSGKRAVVLVVDNSASMGYKDEGVSLLDRVRRAAFDVLDTLRPGDSVSVVLAGRRAAGPQVLFPEPTTALDDVRRALSAVRVSDLGTDLPRALRQAETIALGAPASSREVYLLSDLQDSGWDLRANRDAARTDSDAAFFLVGIRPRTVRDLGITAVQHAAARPLAGVPFAFRPHVINQADWARPAEVALWVDGRKVAQVGVERIQPGRWATPLLHHTFIEGGWHSGYVEVQDADWPANNRRYFALEVRDSLRVLAVDGAPSEVAALDELFFLRTALTAGGREKAAVTLDVRAPGDLAAGDLRGYPLIILANVPSLSPPAIQKIEEYVDRGGSLFVFLGDRVDAGLYNRQLAAPSSLHGGLLPARLVRRAGDPSNAVAYASIARVDAEHPALAAFREPGFASLSSVTFKALWLMEPSESRVLMAAGTGDALLCERAFGKGRVLLFAGTADRDWTDFPVRPAYLPWLHRLAAYLAQEPFGKQPFYTAGDTVPAPLSALGGAPKLLVRKPDGSTGAFAAGGPPPFPLEFLDTAQAGLYTVMGAAEAGSAAATNAPQMFAANLDPYESDLTYLDDVLGASAARPAASRRARIESGFKALLPGRALVAYVDDPAEVREAALNAQRGVKLWDGVLAVVLLIGLLEPWAANRISLRHYVKPAGREPSPQSSS